MKLSVIIVNYNVKYFLEQALVAVNRANEGLSAEIWVVDNNSSDDSVQMVREKFPNVRLIANTENVGFSRANNQAMREATGEYVLLLNPDTIVAEDTFQKCLDFMDAHPEAGALGVKTIDGSGIFLPESKRGFPTPWIAFCKSFGLSSLFPKSKTFNRYYLGHLSPDETNECDILVGSFMLMRQTALTKSGLLDEAFFMYGEDIDLSYRIQNQGFKNYYFSDTTIVHYKGESTKKGSLNYVRIFYGAMIIFAKKHFSGQQATLFIALMQCAVWFRASLTVLGHIFSKVNPFILDAAFIFGGMVWLREFWSSYYFKNPSYVLSSFLYVNTPIYIIIWLSTIYFSGGYDKPVSTRRILRGVFVGTILLSAVYGFLNTEYRSSRMLIVLGSVWTAISLLGIRVVKNFIKNKKFTLNTEGVKRVAFVGSDAEVERAQKLLARAQMPKNIIGTISTDAFFDEKKHIGRLSQTQELVSLFDIEEIVFCGKDIDNQTIIAVMLQLAGRVDFKILAENSQTIIGSSDKNTTGELYTNEISFTIATPANRRNKRVFDILAALFLLLPCVLGAIFSGKMRLLAQNWWAVFIGKKTWIGYLDGASDVKTTIPYVKNRVIPIHHNQASLSPETRHRLNFFYAKDYSPFDDFRFLVNYFHAF